MTSVLFLRGINVGGHRKLPMATLKEALVAAGAGMPETYIQSGNAVYDGLVTGASIAAEIEARVGFSPKQVLLSARAFLQALAENPFPEAEADHKTLHLYFLSDPAIVSEEEFRAAASKIERVKLTGQVLYLHTPKYLSGSELVPKLDRMTGGLATGRNWRTVTKVAEMLERRR